MDVAGNWILEVGFEDGIDFLLSHSQGYASSGDDLEDDACSRTPPSTPSIQRSRTWVEVVENALWIASALFIVYLGDRHSNFIYLLWHNDQIKRIPLYLGIVCVGMNVVVLLHTSPLVWNSGKSSEKWELSSPSSLPVITMLGIFTLFMACMVVSSYLVNGTLKPQSSKLQMVTYDHR
ncbi:Transmembrane protein 128 [Dillenia turbinata]|uniref:Transmembrane protein 128 n=1 Tax=Dillenia turbinata TaxID=194707 RepID=A0AAN8ZPN6_9MAGN